MFKIIFFTLILRARQEALRPEENIIRTQTGYCSKFLSKQGTFGCQPSSAEGFLVDFTEGISNLAELLTQYKKFIQTQNISLFMELNLDIIPLIHIKYLSNEFVSFLTSEKFYDLIKVIVFYIPREKYTPVDFKSLTTTANSSPTQKSKLFQNTSPFTSRSGKTFTPLSVFFVEGKEAETSLTTAQTNSNLFKQNKISTSISKFTNTAYSFLYLHKKYSDKISSRQMHTKSPTLSQDNIYYIISESTDSLLLNSLEDGETEKIFTIGLYLAPYNLSYLTNPKLDLYKNKFSILKTLKQFTNYIYTPNLVHSNRNVFKLANFNSAYDLTKYYNFHTTETKPILQKKDNNKEENTYSNSSKTILIHNNYNTLNLVKNTSLAPIRRRIHSLSVFLQIVADIRKIRSKLFEKASSSNLEKLLKIENDTQIHFLLNSNPGFLRKGESLIFNNFYEIFCGKIETQKVNFYNTILKDKNFKCKEKLIQPVSKDYTNQLLTKYDLVINTQNLQPPSKNEDKKLRISKGNVGWANKENWLETVVTLFKERITTLLEEKEVTKSELIITLKKLLETLEIDKIDLLDDSKEFELKTFFEEFKFKVNKKLKENFESSLQLTETFFENLKTVLKQQNLKFEEDTNFDFPPLFGENVSKNNFANGTENLNKYSLIEPFNALEKISHFDSEIHISSDSNLNKNTMDFDSMQDSILTEKLDRELICKTAKSISLSILKTKYKDYNFKFNLDDCSESGQFINHFEESNLYFSNPRMFLDTPKFSDGLNSSFFYLNEMLRDFNKLRKVGSKCLSESGCESGYECDDGVCVIKSVILYLDKDNTFERKNVKDFEEDSERTATDNNVEIFKAVDYVESYLNEKCKKSFSYNGGKEFERIVEFKTNGSFMESYNVTSKESEVMLMVIFGSWMVILGGVYCLGLYLVRNKYIK